MASSSIATARCAILSSKLGMPIGRSPWGCTRAGPGRTVGARADLRREGTEVRFQVRGVVGPRAAIYTCGAILARAAACLLHPFEVDRVRHARKDPTAVLPRQLRYPSKFRCDASRAQCLGHLSLLRFCFPVAPSLHRVPSSVGSPASSVRWAPPTPASPSRLASMTLMLGGTSRGSLFAPRDARARRAAGLGLVTRFPFRLVREERCRSPRFL